MDASQLDFGLHLDTGRLQDFLAKLWRSQEEISEQQKSLATILESIVKRLEKGEQKFEEQQQALQSVQHKIHGLSDRQDALQRLRIEEKIERFDSHHSDFIGLQAQLAQIDSSVRPHRDTNI